jgi:hypothetical protein
LKNQQSPVYFETSFLLEKQIAKNQHALLNEERKVSAKLSFPISFVREDLFHSICDVDNKLINMNDEKITAEVE